FFAVPESERLICEVSEYAERLQPRSHWLLDKRLSAFPPPPLNERHLLGPNADHITMTQEKSSIYPLFVDKHTIAALQVFKPHMRIFDDESSVVARRHRIIQAKLATLASTYHEALLAQRIVMAPMSQSKTHQLASVRSEISRKSCIVFSSASSSPAAGGRRLVTTSLM